MGDYVTHCQCMNILSWDFQVALLCFDLKRKWVLRKAFFAALHVLPALAPQDYEPQLTLQRPCITAAA